MIDDIVERLTKEKCDYDTRCYAASEIEILRIENAKMREEIMQLEKWNSEIAFNARLFADALKRIDRIKAWKTQDSWDVLWAKIGIMRDIARAALGGAND